MARVEDMLHKMRRRFDASDEHIKELRCDVDSIGYIIDAHAISIKQIELQSLLGVVSKPLTHLCHLLRKM